MNLYRVRVWLRNGEYLNVRIRAPNKERAGWEVCKLYIDAQGQNEAVLIEGKEPPAWWTFIRELVTGW